MLIKKFYTNQVTITKDYLLVRDCLKLNSEDLLIINLNECVYIEHSDPYNNYDPIASFGKIIKIDLETDVLQLRTIKDGMNGLIEFDKEIYIPNIVGMSRKLPGYKSLEKIIHLFT